MKLNSHDATSIVHTWTSSGYLLSSIIHENFILSLGQIYDIIIVVPMCHVCLNISMAAVRCYVFYFNNLKFHAQTQYEFSFGQLLTLFYLNI